MYRSIIIVIGDIKMDGKTTTISLSTEIVEKLKLLGHKGETYNDVLKRILEELEKCRKKSSKC